MILLQLYIFFAVVVVFASMSMFAHDENKLGARALIIAPVWPLAIVVGIIFGIKKLFVTAEWVPKTKPPKRDNTIVLRDHNYLPMENGGKTPRRK